MSRAPLAQTHRAPGFCNPKMENQPEPEPEVAITRAWNIVDPFIGSYHEIRIAISNKQQVKHLVLKYRLLNISEDLQVMDFFGTNNKLQN